MDELSLLHQMHSKTPVATDAAIEEGRRKLLQRIDPALVPGRAKPRRRRTALRFGLGTVATLGVLAALVAGDIVGPAGWRGAATAHASQVLNEAAQAAIQTSDPAVGPGQYLKIESNNINLSSYTDEKGNVYQWLDSEQGTKYVPANRDDEWVWQRSARIPTTFFDDKSKEVALSMQTGWNGELLRGKNGGFYGAPPDPSTSLSYLDSLPRDPYLLLNNIYKKTIGQGQSIDGEALVFIADLLRTGVVPADLRASLYKAAALIPGVTITDEQATLDGRKGIAIGRLEEGLSKTRQEIIIEPTTGLLIGEREVLTQPSGTIPAGTAITWTGIKTSVSDTAP